MSRVLRRTFYFVFVMAAIVLVGAASNTFAQRASRVTDSQVAEVLRTTERDADIFSRTLEAALDRSALNGTRSEDEIKDYVRQFEEATDRLKERFEARREVSSDIEEVLYRAGTINTFLNQNRFNARVTTEWTRVRTDLSTLARYYNVAWNWSNYPTRYPDNRNTGNTFPTRVNDAQVANTLRQLEANADVFSRTLEAALDRSRLNGTQYEDEVKNYVRNFEEATDRLKERFESRRAVSADIEEVLYRAGNIDTFLNQNRMTLRVTNDWTRVRSDLSALANQYNVAWNWNNYTNRLPDNRYPTNTGTASNRLTGTYRLDTVRSANVQTEVDRATVGVDATRRERIRRQAERRLSPPEMLAIERIGQNVTIASSNSPRVTVEANGRTISEQMPNGRSMDVNATLYGDQLTINYTGDRANDFYVAFNPVGNGDLRVTRRLYLEGINQQVTVDSFYTRTSTVAEFDRVYTGNQNTGNNNNYPNNGTYSQSDTFIIPNGTQLIAVLNTDLNTKTAQVGDRFTMEVRSPNQYNGAIIEGRVAEVQRSGRVTGRAQMNLEFDTIRMRNENRTYRFAGLVENIRPLGGGNSDVSINNEGGVREGDNQTTRTVGRTAIGAALGAIIGAIAGGGQGAAVGAAIGAGAGAGTVILQGRDDLELKTGTELTISASAPRNVSSR